MSELIVRYLDNGYVIVGEKTITVCRFCKHYRPDERYKGTIGICDNTDDPTSVKDTCPAFEQGEQKWLGDEK